MKKELNCHFCFKPCMNTRTIKKSLQPERNPKRDKQKKKKSTIEI